MNHFKISLAILSLVALFASDLKAQQPEMQFFRERDNRGINQFEAPFYDDKEFDGLKVRIGGNFAQQFQMLDHSNSYDYTDANPTGQPLEGLAPGFNLATANLNFDVQLEDGIRLALESYMSSRHHPEFWVKGGYLQIDKLPMFGNPQWFDEYVTVKAGHMQVNYGDQQFRRSDNGNVAYNPFVGNYIMDAFTTEIGGEVYVHSRNGLFGMVGLTGGSINGNISDPDPADTLDHSYARNPSIYLKGGWDNNVTDDLRLRFSASYVMNKNTPRNTLYAGDRTGSRYYGVMDNHFTSGRINPGFSNDINALMINAFAKYKGLEFFGTFENASGRSFPNGTDPDAEATEVPTRNVNQIAAEMIYRFLENEQVFVGARYNTVTGPLQASQVDDEGEAKDLSIDRISVGAGWWMTNNILLKAEYVTQNYNDWNDSSIFHEGSFNGLMFEAAIAF